MMPFTRRDRKAGHREMEKTMTPMQKAHRRFVAGRPPAAPKNTPLGAVALATEQRKRLAEILAREKGLKDPQITSMAVVIRVDPPTPGRLADTIIVEDGKEGKAIAYLQQYAAKKFNFVIAGLLFAVLEGTEKRFFPYPIERTPQGDEAVAWCIERQLKRDWVNEVN